MIPSIEAATHPGGSTKTLPEKIEYAILSVLVHYHGQVESSLHNWYLSLKLAFPVIEDPQQIRNSFKQLWENGVIALNSPWIGDYTEDTGDHDLHVLALDQFTVALTVRGVVRWDSIRRWPRSSHEEFGSSNVSPGCLVCRRLSRASELLIEQQAVFNAAHLAAVQDGDLGRAQRLDRPRSEAADRVKHAEDRLKTHVVSHHARTRTAGGG